MAVVVINEDAEDMLELLWVQDQEPVETYWSGSSHRVRERPS